MNNAELPLKLRTVIADVLGLSPEEIHAESRAGQVEGWDSFGHLQIILALESEFAIQFDPQKIPELITAQKLQHALEERGIDLG